MPLYMDQHDTAGASPQDLARAHEFDLDRQDEFGVRFLTYWHDYEGGVANCLVEAPDAAAVNRVHAIAHGSLANRIITVDESEVAAFLGRTRDPESAPIDEGATRTIVFTDIVGSTANLEELGDEAAMVLLRTHNRIVRRLVAEHGGREVKHTGDGFMLAFDTSPQAVRFSLALHQALAETDIAVRIGVNQGRPLAEDGDLFGLAVNIAARLCDRAGRGQTLASAEVVAFASEFDFVEIGPLELKGLSRPVLGFRLNNP